MCPGCLFKVEPCGNRPEGYVKQMAQEVRNVGTVKLSRSIDPRLNDGPGGKISVIIDACDFYRFG